MNWKEMSLEERWGTVLSWVSGYAGPSFHDCGGVKGILYRLSKHYDVSTREARSFMNIMVRQGQIIEQPDGSWITCRDVEPSEELIVIGPGDSLSGKLNAELLQQALQVKADKARTRLAQLKAVAQASVKGAIAAKVDSSPTSHFTGRAIRQLPEWRLATPCKPPEWETRFDDMTFGDIIRTRREDLGYSVDVVAGYCSLPVSQLKAMELNTGVVTMGMQFHALKEILRMTAENDLLYFKEKTISWCENPPIPDIPPLDHEKGDDSEWPPWEERFDGMEFDTILINRHADIQVRALPDTTRMDQECQITWKRWDEIAGLKQQPTFDEVQKIAKGLHLDHLKLTDKAGLLAS